MLLAQAALVIATVLWIGGLLAKTPLNVRAHAGSLTFWWAALVFFIGGAVQLRAFWGIGSDSSDVSAFLTLSPTIIIGVLMVISAVHRGARIEASGALLLVGVFGILIVHVIETPSIMALVSLAMFLPAIVTPSAGYRMEDLVAGARFGIFGVLVGMLITFALYRDALIGACRIDKCSIWGLALGPGGSGNALGLVLAAAALVSLLSVKRWYGLAAIAVGSFVLVDLTSSRSALTALLVGGLVVLAYWLSKASKRRLFVGLATTVLAVVVGFFPFQQWAAQDFTERGGLWLYAQQLIGQSPAFGYGSSFWVRGAATGDGIPLNYSTHSLVTEMLVSVGVFGTIAFALALLFAARGRGWFSTSIYATALIGIAVAMSITEVFSAPGRTYIMAGLMVFVFVAASARTTETATNIIAGVTPKRSRSARTLASTPV